MPIFATCWSTSPSTWPPNTPKYSFPTATKSKTSIRMKCLLTACWLANWGKSWMTLNWWKRAKKRKWSWGLLKWQAPTLTNWRRPSRTSKMAKILFLKNNLSPCSKSCNLRTSISNLSLLNFLSALTTSNTLTSTVSSKGSTLSRKTALETRMPLTRSKCRKVKSLTGTQAESRREGRLRNLKKSWNKN